MVQKVIQFNPELLHYIGQAALATIRPPAKFCILRRREM